MKELIYIIRLRVLGLYLQNGLLTTPIETLSDDLAITDHGDYIDITIPYHVYCLYTLPLYFDEWTMDEDGNPYSINDPHKNTLTSALMFFDLTIDEFMNLFAPGCEMVEHGGKRLTKDAQPADIAYNIFELIKIKEAIW